APATKRGAEERREDTQPKAARPAETSVSPGTARPSDRTLPVRERIPGESSPEKPQTATTQKPEEARKQPVPRAALATETVSASGLAPSKPKSPDAPEVLAQVKSPVTAPEPPEKKPPVPEEMEVSLEAQKRKSESRDEAVLAPEKRPRLAESCQPRAPCRGQPQPFPAAGTTVPRVPPLKIPVSRISPMPFPTNQVSPRARFPISFPSPGRTGARTLADIKAK
ncbi:ASXL2 protein, partial [Thinocorus orbignyianus]|nr:ASXL2 protein [Thinocorus orbignyianus]